MYENLYFYLCIAAQRDIIRRYVNEGRAILYEYIKNGNETKINGRNLYPIYTKEWYLRMFIRKSHISQV